MSIVPKETIEVSAQSIGINNLSPDAALALAPDVEYRLREIMQVFFFFFLQMVLFLFCFLVFRMMIEFMINESGVKMSKMYDNCIEDFSLFI